MTDDEYEKYCDDVMIQYYKDEEKLQRRKALKSLFSKKCFIVDGDIKRFTLKWIVAFFAILLYRDMKCDKSYEYEEMSSWDYSELYAGWEAWFLTVNLKEFRYYIYKDGDWNM